MSNYKKIATHLRANLLGFNETITGVGPEVDEKLHQGEKERIMSGWNQNVKAQQSPLQAGKLQIVQGKEIQALVTMAGKEKAQSLLNKTMSLINSLYVKNEHCNIHRRAQHGHVRHKTSTPRRQGP